MGTTIVSTLVSGDKIYVGHVGDSRVYRVREGGIAQLTRDHSLLEDYKEAKPDMTEEEERNFPHKNVITRALGMRETVQVDIRSHQIKSGDVYILCSDGLSGMVIDNQIRQIATNAKSLQSAVELIDAANRNGARTTSRRCCASARGLRRRMRHRLYIERSRRRSTQGDRGQHGRRGLRTASCATASPPAR
jgi:serine/threonine protein phosphatase PrpC